jgi:hypothetical protein
MLSWKETTILQETEGRMALARKRSSMYVYRVLDGSGAKVGSYCPSGMGLSVQ